MITLLFGIIMNLHIEVTSMEYAIRTVSVMLGDYSESTNSVREKYVVLPVGIYKTGNPFWRLIKVLITIAS